MDDIFMRRALHLAERARGRTSPNPLVGAVVVRDGQVVGEGYHRKAGTPHAEVHALNQAGAMAKGATLYVTLEPCAHYGRTPPCAEAIVKAGIRKVVAAMTDPNPKVAGKGLEYLKKHGVEVVNGFMEDEARQLNEAFLKYITTGMPYVVLKMAMSLDGKIATFTGDSKWITGQEAREFVHCLRDSHDAILVGIGTVLADNPRLTTRLPGGSGRDPIRIILDSKLRIPLDSQVLKSRSNAQTIIATTEQYDPAKKKLLEQMGALVLVLPATNGRVDLTKLLQALAAREITSILVEGGSSVNASFIETGLVDKVYAFIAPKIIGGTEALGPVGGKGVARVETAVPVQSMKVTLIGDDVLICGYLGRKE